MFWTVSTRRRTFPQDCADLVENLEQVPREGSAGLLHTRTHHLPPVVELAVPRPWRRAFVVSDLCRLTENAATPTQILAAHRHNGVGHAPPKTDHLPPDGGIELDSSSSNIQGHTIGRAESLTRPGGQSAPCHQPGGPFIA